MIWWSFVVFGLKMMVRVCLTGSFVTFVVFGFAE